MKDGSFFLDLGVRADTFTVKEFAKSIMELPVSTAAAIVGLAGLDLSLVHLTNQVLDLGIGFNLFRSETGLNVDSMERWEYASKRAGVQAGVAGAAIKGLQTTMTNIKYFGDQQGSLAFSYLLPGKDVYSKSAPAILEMLRERFQTLKNPQEISKFASMLSRVGVDESMTMAFHRGNADFMQDYNTAPLINDRQVDRLMELKAAMVNLSDHFIYDFAGILDKNLPAITTAFNELAAALKIAMPPMLALANALIAIVPENKTSAGMLGNMSGGDIASGLLDIVKHIPGPIDWTKSLMGLMNGGAGPTTNDNRLSLIQHNYGMPGTPEEAHKFASEQFMRAAAALDRVPH